jgi:bifunctional UDP-N-acetylglucosamine pyrophosphorylase/glucosamine-1-phosphate N-acetyltransferase
LRSQCREGAWDLIGIILAAGVGKRLKPLTETRPKVLIPVGGKPVLFYSLKMLSLLGIRDVYIVVSYMRDYVEKSIKSIADELQLNVRFVDQKEPLGTAHAVRVVTENVLDDAIIVYGDLYIDPEPVARILRSAVEKRFNMLTAVDVEDSSKYGKLVIDGERVVKVIEKPVDGGKGLANAGIYVVRAKTLQLVSEIRLSPRGEYELTDLIELASSRDEPFRYAILSSELWQDIGYPWDLLKANKMALDRIKAKTILGDVDPHATIKGPVYIEEGAVIKGCTYIEGPAYIASNASIGPNAYIRPYTTIMSGAHIGFAVEVKESIVMENTHAAHLTYIGDSIIAEHVNLGAGTLLANLRFDEATVKVFIEGKKVDSGRRKLGAIIGGYVKTGVNVSIMPGVKIGSYSIIYPGVTVYRDVPPRTVVKKDWL